MSKFIYSFSVILFGLFLGYLTQVLVSRELIRLALPIDGLRKLLQRIALLFINPIAVVGAIWVVSLKDITLVALPFVGLLHCWLGGRSRWVLPGCLTSARKKAVACMFAALLPISAQSVLWSALFF